MKTGSPRGYRWRGLLAACLALSACQRSPDSGTPVLRVADQQQHLQQALTSAGEDHPVGYRIEWANILGGPPIVAAETGGSVDLGWMMETPLAFAQAAGSPVTVVAASKGARPDASNIALVVAPGSPIHTIAELKGKRVSYAPGTITQYMIVRVLQSAGLSLNDIQSVRVTSLNTHALSSGLVDAFVTAEPMLSQGLANHQLRVLAPGGEPYTPGLGYLVAANSALADAKRARLIGDFVARVARATKWQREHIAQAAPVSARAYGVSTALAARILRRTAARYTPIDAGIIASQQQEDNIFSRLGLIGKSPDAGRLFDDRYNAAVAAVENGQ